MQDRKWRSEIGLGPVRQVSLAEAREIARQWCQIAKAGGDPKAERDKLKRKSMTFSAAAKRVHREQVEPHAKNPKHAAQWLKTLEDYAFPVLGVQPVNAVSQGDVLKVLAPIWTTKPEPARRVRQRVRTVFDWAGTAGFREGVNPVEGVDKGLPRQRDKVRHHTALPYQQLPNLMQRLETVEGLGVLALRFAVLTACRSGEVRLAHWSEIDMERRIWIVPASR